MSEIELVGKCIMGITHIDNQHHHLVDLLNQLHGTIIAKSSNEEIHSIINSIFEYVSTHFRDEEKLMEELYFPGLESHRKKHTQFVNKLQNVYTKYHDNKFLKFKFFSLLMDLLLNHIEYDDSIFATYYKKHHNDYN